MPDASYPRDLVGYGRAPPHAQWPGDARVAVQFVLNYEEGGESSVLHGDPVSEQFLSEIIGAEAYRARHLSMESIYEYGSRAGVWRLLREFERRRLPLTVFGVAMALERNPGRDGGVCPAWPRNRLPRVALDSLPERRRGHRARAHADRRRVPPSRYRGSAGRLVHRPRQPEHAAPGRRARRLSL